MRLSSLFWASKEFLCLAFLLAIAFFWCSSKLSEKVTVPPLKLTFCLHPCCCGCSGGLGSAKGPSWLLLLLMDEDGVEPVEPPRLLDLLWDTLLRRSVALAATLKA